jgi:heat shock protein HslJ
MSGRLATSSFVVLAALCGCDGANAGEADVNALKDVPWALVSGIDVVGWQAVAPTVTITGGRLSAWAGCNRIGAPVEIDGDAMRIDGDHIQTTLKGCHGTDGEMERAFLAALKRVRTWGIADDRLTLRTDGGDELLGRSDRGTIAIDPPRATEKQCAEPEGVMEQEHKYLTALPRSAGYPVEGDGLDLLASDGTFVAMFGRR